MRAIEAGAEVIIAGRAFDPAMMGAHALLRGFDRGLTVHMGKLLECGGAAAYPRHGSDGLLATLHRNSFTVEPPNPDKVCTVASVAAHSLYERANPYHMEFPGGAIDLHATRFEQESERVVRISGPRYIEAPHYTIKLEGVERIGYRTIAIAGVRDPILISRFDDYVANIRSRVAERYPDGYRLAIHSYGRNGVMGSIEATRTDQPFELGLVFEVIADDPETSAAVLALARSAALHVTYPGRKGIAGNLAFPRSPHRTLPSVRSTNSPSIIWSRLKIRVRPLPLTCSRPDVSCHRAIDPCPTSRSPTQPPAIMRPSSIRPSNWTGATSRWWWSTCNTPARRVATASARC